MNNLDIRRALYNSLDLKNLNITLANSGNLKVVSLTSDSIFNIYVYSDAGVFVSMNNNSAKSYVYYSDFKAKLRVITADGFSTIYFENNSGSNLEVKGVFIEVTKGKIVQVFTTISSDAMNETPHVTVDDTNKTRFIFNDHILVNKTELNGIQTSLNNYISSYNDHIDDYNSFVTNYTTWINSLGYFAYIDKINLSNRDDFLGINIITTNKIVNENVTKVKLSSTLQASIDLADSSVQIVKLNNGSNLNISGVVNIQAATKISMGGSDYSSVPESGEGNITIDNWNTYIQPLLTGNENQVVYFSANNVLGRKNIIDFVLKNEIDTNFDNPINTKVASTKLLSDSLDLKVDKIVGDKTRSLSLVKVSVNNRGLISGSELVSISDLTGLLGNYYLTESYTWDNNTGTLKLK